MIGAEPASGKSAQNEKRMAGGQPPRKRGGQPGNQNAAKRGWYTKESRELRARVKNVVKRANDAVAWVEQEYGLKRKRGRPRKYE